jgi:hypothetical protein
MVERDCDPSNGRKMEPQRAKAVGEDHGILCPQAPITDIKKFSKSFFIHHMINHIKGKPGRKSLIKENPPYGGFVKLPFEFYLNPGMELDRSYIIGITHLGRRRKGKPFTPGTWTLAGEIVTPQDNILRGSNNRLAIRRREDIVGAHHQTAGFNLSLDGKGNMDSHLVPIKICIERRTDEGMKLDRLSFNQNRLKSLDSEAMKGGSPVEKDGMLLDHLFEGIPDLTRLLLYELLGTLDRAHDPFFYQFVVNKGSEKLNRHLFREPTLMEFKLRSNNNHGAPGVVNSFSQKVLAEPPLLSFEKIGKAL